jgi:hypothetical protein
LSAADAGERAGAVEGSRRPSLHDLPDLADEAWIADLRLMLGACKQAGLAELVSVPSAASARVPAVSISDRVPPGERAAFADVLPVVKRPAHRRLARRLKQELGSWLRERAARSALAPLRSLFENEDIHHVLLIRASVAARCTRAVVAGLRRNANTPKLIWLHDATPALLPGRSRRPGERATNTGAALSDPDGTKRRFEAVVVGQHAELDQLSRDALSSARFVVLTGINDLPTQRIHGRLRQHAEYELIAHHPTDDNGYSAFRRLSGVGAQDRKAS